MVALPALTYIDIPPWTGFISEPRKIPAQSSVQSNLIFLLTLRSSREKVNAHDLRAASGLRRVVPGEVDCLARVDASGMERD